MEEGIDFINKWYQKQQQWSNYMNFVYLTYDYMNFVYLTYENLEWIISSI